MEIDTISKYAINILLDYKPGEVQMTPEAEALRPRGRGGTRSCLQRIACPSEFALAMLLSEVTRSCRLQG